MNDSGDESSIPDADKESAKLENDASALINKVNLSFCKFGVSKLVLILKRNYIEHLTLIEFSSMFKINFNKCFNFD